MALLRPTVWTQQPQSPVEIDWSNPITQGLVNAANINGGSPAYNLVLGKPAPTGGTLTPSAFAMGYGKKFASAAIQFPLSVYTGAETMLSVCRPTTVDANLRAIMHRRNTTTIGVAQAGATMWLLAYDNAIGLQLIAWQSSGATCVAINSGSANVASNETLVAVGVVPGNGLTAALYKNGNLVNSATQSAALMNTVVTTEVGGMHANNTSRYFAGDQSLALHWNRALSDAEIRSISANPWQIFKPIPRRLFVPVSSGGANTWNLDPTSASHGQTSGVGALVLSYLLSAASASHAQSVTQSAIALAYTLSPSGALHAQSATVSEISSGNVFDPVSSSHAHSAASPAISLNITATPASASHAHSAGPSALNLRYVLSVNGADHAQIAGQCSLTIGGAGTGATAEEIAAAVWAHVTRTLTASAGPSAESIAAATVSALMATMIPVDVQKMNGATVLGDGTSGNKWRG